MKLYTTLLSIQHGDFETLVLQRVDMHLKVSNLIDEVRLMQSSFISINLTQLPVGRNRQKGNNSSSC